MFLPFRGCGNASCPGRIRAFVRVRGMAVGKESHTAHDPYLAYIRTASFNVNLLDNPSVQKVRKRIRRLERSMTFHAARRLQRESSDLEAFRLFLLDWIRPLGFKEQAYRSYASPPMMGDPWFDHPNRCQKLPEFGCFD